MCENLYTFFMGACRLLVTGIVQGVFFRAEAKRKANELGLTGWVRNCDDGSVEIHAEGPKEKLKELEQWCWKGPPKAMVQKVILREADDEWHSSFTVI